MYILSLIVSIFNLVMTILKVFSDESSRIHSLHSMTVTYTLIGVSIVFIVLGLVSEVRRDKEGVMK